MMFFTDERAFFTSYETPSEFADDLSYILLDPWESVCNLIRHGIELLLLTAPLAMIGITYGAPFAFALSIPLALSLLSLNTCGMIVLGALALLTVPLIYTASCMAYDVIDIILSPIVDILRIITNLAATGVEESGLSEAFVL